MWLQKEITLKPRPRGFHLVTDELLRELPELRDFRGGMMSVFILYTSQILCTVPVWTCLGDGIV